MQAFAEATQYWGVVNEWRESYYEFFKAFWESIDNNEFKENWHLKYLCDEAQKVMEWVINGEDKQYDLLINVPPGTSKSSIISKLAPVWLWLRKPSAVVISSSYSFAASKRNTEKSRDCLSSEKFQKYFGEEVVIRDDHDNKTEHMNTHGGIRITVGTNGSITGAHAHLITVDDPVKPPSAKGDADGESTSVISETNLRTANAWHDTVLSSRKVDRKNTPTIYVMQRLHENDVIGHILNKAEQGLKIKHICLPAEINSDSSELQAFEKLYRNGKVVEQKDLSEFYIDDLLDPIRLDKEALEQTKIDQGVNSYAGQYLQRPTPDEGGMIKKKWFKVVKEEELPTDLTRNFYSDTAYGKTGSDDTALGCVSNYKGKLVIWNVSRVNLPSPRLKRHYKQYVVNSGFTTDSRCWIEPKASGLSIIQDFAEDCFYMTGDGTIWAEKEDIPEDYREGVKQISMNVKEGEAPTIAKEYRISAISTILSNQNVWLVDGTWVKPFLDQCSMFPLGKKKDMVDVLEMAVRNEIQQPKKKKKVLIRDF
jgi:hypothetical protein